MGISLSKGQGVSLRKVENDLSHITVGLGWDIVEKKKSGFLGGMFQKKEADYDLDAVAFLCGADGKVADLGRDASGNVTLVNSDVVFFNNQRHRSGKIWLTGDNRTGAGDGDDEQIIVNLNELPAAYQKVVFVVQIYKGIENNQSFGNVRSAFIRAADRSGKELVRFDLSGGTAFDNCRSLVFAEIVRDGANWQFNAIGAPHETDSFVELLRQYM
jgi:stress response protein SCP2